MARSPSKKRFRRVYWDSCTWISVIQNETAVPLAGGGTENRTQMGRAVIDDAENQLAEIVTSALAFSEVHKPASEEPDRALGIDKLAAFFENEYIVIVPLNRRVGELARKLMQQGHSGLKPLDAVHLASALVSKVDEMHCFDDRLLKLSEKLEKLDGTPLRICKPSMGGPPLPLLESVQDDPDGASDPDEEENEHDDQSEAVPAEPAQNTSPDAVAGGTLHGNGADLGLQRGRGDIQADAQQHSDPEADNATNAQPSDDEKGAEGAEQINSAVEHPETPVAEAAASAASLMSPGPDQKTQPNEAQKP